MLTIDQQQTTQALREAADQYVTLLRSRLDGRAPAVGTWDVTAVATHVCVAVEVYAGLLADQPSPIDVLERRAQRNQEFVDAYDGDRDLHALANRTAQQLADLADVLDAQPSGREILWHAGIRLPLSRVTAMLLGEFLLHGYDIATGSRRPWPMDDHHARLALAGALPLAPLIVNHDTAASLRATFELRPRDTDPVQLRFDRGELSVTAPNGRRVDCYLTGGPVPFLLSTYGRLSPWRAAATGKIRAYGRRPWLAFRFDRLLHNP